MCGKGLTIITTNERIPILVLQLAVDILLSVLHGNVHVAIKACKDACKQHVYHALKTQALTLQCMHCTRL